MQQQQLEVCCCGKDVIAVSMPLLLLKPDGEGCKGAGTAGEAWEGEVPP